MQRQKRLGELVRECKQLGIEVVPEDKIVRRNDCIRALRNYCLNKKYPDGRLPGHLKTVLGIPSVMLCYQFKDMDEGFKDTVWTDDDWVAQEKIEGVRALAVYNKDDDGKLHLYSRYMSLADCCPVEYANVFLGSFDAESLSKNGINSFVLDIELYCSKAQASKILGATGCVETGVETPVDAINALLGLNTEVSLRIQREQEIKLEFNAIHLLEMNGHDFMQVPWDRMQQVLEELVKRLRSLGLTIDWILYVMGEDKKAFFDWLIEQGREGIVLKGVKSIYHPTESRSHREWVKCKRVVEKIKFSR